VDRRADLGRGGKTGDTREQIGLFKILLKGRP
jgi:hypothetical protein